MVTTKTPWFIRHTPEIGRAFQEFSDLCHDDGVLDKKTKALLMLAAASLMGHHGRLEERLREAFEAGASKAEVTQTLLMAALQSAEIQLDSDIDLYRKYLAGSSSQWRNMDRPTEHVGLEHTHELERM